MVILSAMGFGLMIITLIIMMMKDHGSLFRISFVNFMAFRENLYSIQ